MIVNIEDVLDKLTQAIANIELELLAYEPRDEETVHDILEGERVIHRFIWRRESLKKSSLHRIFYERYNKLTNEIEMQNTFRSTPVAIRLRFAKHLGEFREKMIEYLKYND